MLVITSVDTSRHYSSRIITTISLGHSSIEIYLRHADNTYPGKFSEAFLEGEFLSSSPFLVSFPPHSFPTSRDASLELSNAKSMMDISQLISGRGVNDYKDVVKLLALPYPTPDKPYTALKALGDQPHSEYLLRALTLHAVTHALPADDEFYARALSAKDTLLRNAFIANRLSSSEFKDVITLSRRLVAL